MDQGFQLAFQTAEGPTVRHFNQDQVLLGHGGTCHVVLDPPVERKHAEIVRDVEGWTIHDLRGGVAVNDRRVTRQRLADGDRIVLAPDAAAPALLEFRLSQFAAPTPPHVIVSDESGPTSVIASIDLRELSNSLEQSGGGQSSRIELCAGDTTNKLLAYPHAPGRSLFESTSQLPVLSLFKSAGEILLAHESLDGMLQQVVNLIVEHLPGPAGRALHG